MSANVLRTFTNRSPAGLAGEADSPDSIEAAAQRFLRRVGGKKCKEIEDLDYRRDRNEIVLRTAPGENGVDFINGLVDRGMLTRRWTGVRHEYEFEDQQFGTLTVSAEQRQRGFTCGF